MYKHGIAVMRCQPFHIGHERIVDEMLKQCEMVTVILGSTQRKDEKNPWPFHDRKKMIKNVYKDTPEWDKLKILGAQDINNDSRWAKFILEDIVKEYYVEELEMQDYPEVDAYFAGSKFDAQWFDGEVENIVYVDRTFQEFPFVSGTMVRDMMIMQDVRWKLFTNKVNHDLLNKHYSWCRWDRL